MQVELQSVKLLPGVVKLFLGFNAIGDSLLILSEKDVVFDLDIFWLRETKFGDTEVVF